MNTEATYNPAYDTLIVTFTEPRTVVDHYCPLKMDKVKN